MPRVVISLGYAALVAVCTGVVVGSLARALMRAIALLGEQETSFSVAVSAGIVAFFVLAVLPGALVAAVTRSPWRWLAFVPTIGLLLLSGLAIAGEDVEEARAHDLGATQWVGISGLAAVILLLVLAQPLLVVRLLDRRAQAAGAVETQRLGADEVTV